MVFIRGGSFSMGTNDGLPVEAPIHEVTVKSFWMDLHEVTVAQFAQFVKATDYKTESEEAGWSGVFNVRSARWERADGADWQHPEGPSSSASPDEPVTHVSWNDAVAYAKWAKKRLPTEAEFEYAARGGLANKKYAWGDELNPKAKYMCNQWQGIFPVRNLGDDGFIGRAPVGSFPPNGYGLYDITGNVWEWCADWFDENYYNRSPKTNPQGPPRGEDRVIRGGSWLCSENYCTGYRVAARNHTAPDSGSNNLGFRCVRE
jgi:formylglycine-generating enzyme required for sulfatase activity